MSRNKNQTLYKARGELTSEVIFYVYAKDPIEAKVKIENGDINEHSPTEFLDYRVTGTVEEDK